MFNSAMLHGTKAIRAEQSQQCSLAPNLSDSVVLLHIRKVSAATQAKAHLPVIAHDKLNVNDIHYAFAAYCLSGVIGACGVLS